MQLVRRNYSWHIFISYFEVLYPVEQKQPVWSWQDAQWWGSENDETAANECAKGDCSEKVSLFQFTFYNFLEL